MAGDVRGANLGLYLCPEVIIAVFTRSVRGAVRIASVGTTPMPRGGMDVSMVRDPARVGQAIKALLRSMRSRVTSASVAMPPASSGMRSYRLPDAPDREKRLLVRGELENSGALPLGAGAFGHLWIRTPSEEDRSEADVFAFYSDDLGIENVRESLRLAGLRLECIEPYSVAAMRAYLLSRERPEPVAMVCASDAHTDLCIHDGKQVRYFRRIIGGWDDLRYERSYEGGAPSGGAAAPVYPLGASPAADADDTASSEPLPPDTASTRGFLAAEIARSFAYYSRDYRAADVPRSLVVLSAERIAQNIVDSIGSAIPIPVSIDDASSKLELPENTAGEGGLLGFLAAAGTALGDNAEAMPRVDTSRQEAAAITRRQAPNILLMGMAGSTVWMICCVAALVALAILQSNVSSENSRLQAEINTEWEKHAAPLRNQEVFAEARNAQTKVAVSAPAVLAAIGQAYTPYMSAGKIEIQAESKVVIEGTALTPESLQEFVDNLAATGALGTPAFDMMHQDADGRFSFRILGSCKDLTPEGALKSEGG